MLNLYCIAYPVTSLGPGKRVVVWVAGCARNCEGCISREMRDPEAGKLIDTKTIIARLARIQHRIDGITISGGEPFDQAEALVGFLKQIRRTWLEWDVIVYTGYTIEQIYELGSKAINILKHVDVLIDGQYEMEVPQNHPLAGSGNQRVHTFTKRGQELITLVDGNKYDAVNFGIGKDNQNMIIGVPNTESRVKLGGMYA